jgi:hypothetical protein
MMSASRSAGTNHAPVAVMQVIRIAGIDHAIRADANALALPAGID